MPKEKSILIVCPYPFDEAPSQRFRYEQYLNYLKANGYTYQIAPFLSHSAWQILYKKGSFIKKIWSIIKGFSKRKLLLFSLQSYDFIFIHREATPVGPPFFEWAVKHLWRKPIIYDFDDAIWLEDAHEKGTFKSIVKWKSKVAAICKWSDTVSCGNQYLADFALQYNTDVIVNPTTIDTEELHLPQKNTIEKDKLVVGWTGTHSTLQYLDDLIGPLKRVHDQIPFRLLIIANKMPEFDFPEMDFLPWQKSSEVADLNKIDIGIMPLTDDQWSKGKCGFKALQYMALEKVVIGSAVGVNKQIIPNGGLLANSAEEWENSLLQLIRDSDLRKQLGKGGRTYIKEHYSVKSNRDNFLDLFSKIKKNQ